MPVHRRNGAAAVQRRIRVSDVPVPLSGAMMPTAIGRDVRRPSVIRRSRPPASGTRGTGLRGLPGTRPSGDLPSAWFFMQHPRRERPSSRRPARDLPPVPERFLGRSGREPGQVPGPRSSVEPTPRGSTTALLHAVQGDPFARAPVALRLSSEPARVSAPSTAMNKVYGIDVRHATTGARGASSGWTHVCVSAPHVAMNRFSQVRTDEMWLWRRPGLLGSKSLPQNSKSALSRSEPGDISLCRHIDLTAYRYQCRPSSQNQPRHWRS